MDRCGEEKIGFASRWVPAQSTVKAYIRSLVRDAQHAEDLLQEVAMRAHEHFEQFDTSRPFIGWVLGIARYQVLAYFKRSRSDRHVFSDQLLASIEARFATMQPSLNAREEALKHCIRKLPERMSSVVSARYRDGLSAPQIAERSGGSPIAVNTTLFRARKLLKQCIEERLGGKGVARG